MIRCGLTLHCISIYINKAFINFVTINLSKMHFWMGMQLADKPEPNFLIGLMSKLIMCSSYLVWFGALLHFSPGELLMLHTSFFFIMCIISILLLFRYTLLSCVYFFFFWAHLSGDVSDSLILSFSFSMFLCNFVKYNILCLWLMSERGRWTWKFSTCQRLNNKFHLCCSKILTILILQVRKVLIFLNLTFSLYQFVFVLWKY